MMKRERVSNFQHPFDEYPFEVFYRNSWQMVERLRVSNGAIALSLAGIGFVFEERGLLSTLRPRPRKANSSDCTFFLRPRVDVRVLSTCWQSENSCEEPVSLWLDAKISSIKRKPHESGCMCEFYVQKYNIKDSPKTDKGLPSKEVKLVGIDQILIFQKLQQKPCEDTHFRWSFAEDCISAHKTKMFLGKFLSDISWLVIASVQKQFSFDVRSMGNKIVYQILDCSFDNCSSDEHISGLNFKMDGELCVPIIIPFVPVDTLEAMAVEDVDEIKPLSNHPPVSLRRSRRRNVQPDRYLGEIGLEAVDITALRIGYKYKEEMSLVLYNDGGIQGDLLEDSEQSFEAYESFLVSKVGVESLEEKSGTDDQRANQDHLAIIPLPSESNQISHREENHLLAEICETELGDDVPLKYYRKRKREKKAHSKSLSGLDCVNDKSRLEGTLSKGRTNLEVNISDKKSRGKNSDPITDGKYWNYMQDGSRWVGTITKDESRWVEIISDKKPRRRRGRPIASRRDWDYVQDESIWGGMFAMDESQWGRKVPNKKPHGRRYRPFTSTIRRDRDEDVGSSKKKTLDAGEYKDLITAYMKKIQATIENKQPDPGDPWKQILEEKSMNEREAAEEAATKEEEDENSEIEMLWREMEFCLASMYLENNQNPKAEALGGGRFCQHEFKLDEEVGLLCPLCGYVLTEIRDVSPPFLQAMGWTLKHERTEKDDLEHKLIDEVGMDFVSCRACSDTLLSESNDNVWALIPDIRKKLHIHQKKAFEFLWRNIAGSLVPADMETSSKKIGGCVISHSPGAGKTFLIIAFLLSYLKIFPGKRPLVLAPKTTLYTWYKEIIKWEFPVPVYQIHGRRTYRDRIYMRKLEGSSSNLVPSGDVMHILDCLEKLQKWHAHPSVLLMGYTSFMTLMREDSKYAYRRYMGKLLRESPGVLILDEGHNPRSTKSRLRKALMRIETDIRILLSGTLFQNNFGEFFNTLCLARPKFVNEVLRKLDPKYKRKKNGVKKTRTSIENRARKVFVDIIGRKINSNISDERMEGLNMLKNMTNGFIDVYEGGSSENLPGLQSYTLMMKPTPMQHEILVKLHKFMSLCRGFPLELELMITLGSIHPWLIKTAVCAHKFLSLDELRSLEEHKLDPSKGSKVKFVLGLVHRCIIKREKVLIFCHNIAPINLFLELFERIYGWRKGEEVLVLQGDLELFERGRVMDKFEERGGPSKVMLASINACAEGISLTAASRVILLDSEWNPSKQKQAIARAFRPGQEKVVYVYQLLASGTLEEDKYKRTTWKEWVSCMIFSEEMVDDPSQWQAEKIEDAMLREIVEEDHAKLFHMIMKNEKASYENPLARVNE
ncbi:hypothetical protein Nepgr_032390 [Nepenthes gracilis]|uniref:Uncharacterized protein n=1 Tax=Nepenthes gracilis TaxID=150966 RepID=A0AAD3TJD6_NEPGR|nr:hypothetical protein Nepgr_032390 [Nepenthes gracilis]